MLFKEIRLDFPIFKHNPELVYLDSAATSHKPDVVIQAIHDFYSKSYASVHRGVYALSEHASQLYEDIREKTAKFLGEQVLAEEIIFTSGTTDATNLVAETLGEGFLNSESEVLICLAEHHSSLLPWQKIAKKTGATLKYFGLNNRLRIDLNEVKAAITPKTRVLVFAHVSNVLGYIVPAQELCDLAKANGVLTVIDGAQAIPHFHVDVKKLGCDFYCFSAHKVLGPTGLGILYGKKALLEQLPPYRVGGSMITTASLEGAKWALSPTKFEAGTPPVASVIGFGAALDYLAKIDRKAALEHDQELGLEVYDFLKSKDDIHILQSLDSNAHDWVGLVSFVHKLVHPHDIATILDENQVCVRAGFHCAEPLAKYLSIGPSIRVSPYLYNNQADIKQFKKGMETVQKIFSL